MTGLTERPDNGRCYVCDCAGWRPDCPACVQEQALFADGTVELVCTVPARVWRDWRKVASLGTTPSSELMDMMQATTAMHTPLPSLTVEEQRASAERAVRSFEKILAAERRRLEEFSA